MSEPIWIEDNLVLAIHDRLLVEHGGAEGVRGKSLLQSALSRLRSSLFLELTGDRCALGGPWR